MSRVGAGTGTRARRVYAELAMRGVRAQVRLGPASVPARSPGQGDTGGTGQPMGLGEPHRTAANRTVGYTSTRVFVTPLVALERHLRVKARAHVHLDTLHYNAHTTGPCANGPHSCRGLFLRVYDCSTILVYY